MFSLQDPTTFKVSSRQRGQALTYGELERNLLTEQGLRVVFRCDPDMVVPMVYEIGFLYCEDYATIATVGTKLRELIQGPCLFTWVSPNGNTPHGQTHVRNLRFYHNER